ncbi:uncharacterized protein LOC143256371 isoform X3 [Tachypleus tridentatus]|uniref:uncharacterized protein LOC143256371 isoform X3 n=1 Tax=Tachypleus tridentatus TaxID=6853 RepID=UPI003FCF527D
MSIVIHIGSTAHHLPSSVTVTPLPACIIETETSSDMGPGVEHKPVEVSEEYTEPIGATPPSVSTAPVQQLPRHERKPYAHSPHPGYMYPGCFGLPYQDHNYGAPPPPSPPQSPCPKVNGSIDEDTSFSVISTTSTNNDTETQEESITRCICGFNRDDEYMICCDKCCVWQHVDCMGLDRNSIPDTYLCEKCEPRKVDRHKAKALQIRKKEEMTGAQNRKQERSRSRSGQSRTNKKVRQVNSEEGAVEVKVRRKSKCKSGNTSTADEEEQEAWVLHMNLKEWIDSYEQAVTNQYTPEVQLLAGVMRVHNELVSEQLQAQLCKVSEISKTQRCLVSTQHIKKEQVIVEYRGRFLTLSQFHGQHPVFRSRVFPFVLFHKPHEDEEGICVDARDYGNIARFIHESSCTPNAEVRHAILNGLLHLYIFSRKDIKKEQEITIPFDFVSEDGNTGVQCACGKQNCGGSSTLFWVQNHNKSFEVNNDRKRKRKTSVTGDDLSSHNQLKELDSDTSINSTVKTRFRSCSTGDIKQCQQEENETHGMTLMKDSVDEGRHEMSDQSLDRRRKRTREERKLEAIMRAFEQMEKSEKKKQQAREKISQQKVQKQQAGHDGVQLKQQAGHDGVQLKQQAGHDGVQLKQQAGYDGVQLKQQAGYDGVQLKQQAGHDGVQLKQQAGHDSDQLAEEEKPQKNDEDGNPLSTTLEGENTKKNQLNGDLLSSEEGKLSTQSQSTQHTPYHKRGKKRRSSGSASRRRTRTNSGSSEILSPDEGSLDHFQNSASMQQLAFDLAGTDRREGFIFPKSKRFLMNEWMQEKAETVVPVSCPLTIHTELSWDLSTASPTCYVRCTKDTPSGPGILAPHLRRNSTSGNSGKQSSSIGSAKKRWLRQAMCETEPLGAEGCGIETSHCSPLHNGCMSPNPQSEANSPCLSPSGDVLTPLKKRRMMRASRDSVPSPVDHPESNPSTSSPEPSLGTHGENFIPSVFGIKRLTSDDFSGKDNCQYRDKTSSVEEQDSVVDDSWHNKAVTDIQHNIDMEKKDPRLETSVSSMLMAVCSSTSISSATESSQDSCECLDLSSHIHNITVTKADSTTVITEDSVWLSDDTVCNPGVKVSDISVNDRCSSDVCNAGDSANISLEEAAEKNASRSMSDDSYSLQGTPKQKQPSPLPNILESVEKADTQLSKYMSSTIIASTASTFSSETDSVYSTLASEVSYHISTASLTEDSSQEQTLKTSTFVGKTGTKRKKEVQESKHHNFLESGSMLLKDSTPTGLLPLPLFEPLLSTGTSKNGLKYSDKAEPNNTEEEVKLNKTFSSNEILSETKRERLRDRLHREFGLLAGDSEVEKTGKEWSPLLSSRYVVNSQAPAAGLKTTVLNFTTTSSTQGQSVPAQQTSHSSLQPLPSQLSPRPVFSTVSSSFPSVSYLNGNHSQTTYTVTGMQQGSSTILPLSPQTHVGSYLDQFNQGKHT